MRNKRKGEIRHEMQVLKPVSRIQIAARLNSVRRHSIVQIVLLSAVITGAAILCRAGNSAEEADVHKIKVTEATNIAATLSPDHKTIIVDVQGLLWSMPAEGGKAKQLTPPLLEPARPDWSPRGDAIAFEAYEGGTFHIWMMKPDGSEIRQLTFGHGDDREPRWSPDGTHIAFSSDRAFTGSYDIWVLDVASGKLTPVTSDPSEEFEPTWSPDGSRIAFVTGPGGGTQIESVNLSGGARAILVTAPKGARLDSPSWSPDGTNLAYIQTQGFSSHVMLSGVPVQFDDDVFPFYPQWLSDTQILYTANGKVRVTSIATNLTLDVPFEAQVTVTRPRYAQKQIDFESPAEHQVKGIVSPAFSPNGKSVVFEALNQLWIMEIGKKPRQITTGNFFKADPAWSPDGTRIAYASDKSGIPQIYILDPASGEERQVTSLPEAATSPAWSHDGSKLAFLDHTDALQVVDLASGNTRQIFGPQFAPGRPSWSADGSSIAFAALKKYSHRFREGTSQILTVRVADGTSTYTEPAPFKSVTTRGDDGPVLSPDGTLAAFVMDEVLWTAPVDFSGRITGPARQINDEPTDAPSWSGDSQRLLYLSNGKLRLISREGSNPVAVACDLTWRRDIPGGKTLVHAGRLWDGNGAAVQENVDVWVVNNRIASIKAHSATEHARAAAEHDLIVDAAQQTVIPGLWESHTHHLGQGKFYGDRLGRLWLAYGVTTLESYADPAYRAVEAREAFASGARVGPRLFATGEAIDGERVYYSSMRPDTTEKQLELSLSRAKALDYDMIKTYVRLPAAYQAKVAEFAHNQMGVWTVSHYALPGMTFGVDGMAHISATARTGYAYTRSAGGVTYQDVIDIICVPGNFAVSTALNASLYAEDPMMVEDPRLQILNLPWEQQSFLKKRDAVMLTDQTASLEGLRREETTVGRIRKGGGMVLAGTDSPLDNIGTALHLNLRDQVKFGLAPWQALQSATLLPARAYHKDHDLGSIEVGKLADMVFVTGNPLVNIADAANVQRVMKDGKLYTVPELEAPIKAAELGPAAHYQTAPELMTGDTRWAAVVRTE